MSRNSKPGLGVKLENVQICRIRNALTSSGEQNESETALHANLHPREAKA